MQHSKGIYECFKKKAFDMSLEGQENEQNKQLAQRHGLQK